MVFGALTTPHSLPSINTVSLVLCCPPQLKPSFAKPSGTKSGHKAPALQRMAAQLLGGKMRQRFFQLSSDFTTLRWAWNKYILLYYVDSLTADSDALTITLHMALDPDLTLKFKDPKTYDIWESGLRLLLAMLTGPAPDHVGAGGNLHCADGGAGGSMTGSQRSLSIGTVSAQHGLVMTALNIQRGVQACGTRRSGSKTGRLRTSSSKNLLTASR